MSDTIARLKGIAVYFGVQLFSVIDWLTSHAWLLVIGVVTLFFTRRLWRRAGPDARALAFTIVVTAMIAAACWARAVTVIGPEGFGNAPAMFSATAALPILIVLTFPIAWSLGMVTLALAGVRGARKPRPQIGRAHV